MNPKQTIAVIQPDPQAAARSHAALAEIGADVWVARDAAEFALRLERCGFPDLVLTAMRLPFMDGLRVARWMRQNPLLRRVPVVLCEQDLSAPEVQDAYRAGCTAVVRQPLTRQLLDSLLALRLPQAA